MADHNTTSKRSRRLLYEVVFSNIVFFLYLIHYLKPFSPFALFSIIALLVFVLPGLAWANMFSDKLRNPAAYIFAVIFLSTVWGLCSYVSHFLTGFDINSQTHAAFLFLVTNAGFLIAFRKVGRRGKAGERSGTGKLILSRAAVFSMLLIFLCAYLFLYWFSLNFVPALEDNDFELGGTAYGLTSQLKPHLLSDRKTTLYFAHPPLIHLYAADFFLLSDKIDEARPYYDIARLAQRYQKKQLQPKERITLYGPESGYKRYEIESIADGKVMLDKPLRDGVKIDYGRYLEKGRRIFESSQIRDAMLWALIEREYAVFAARPNLIVTRISNIFLGALTCALIFYCIYILLGSVLWAFLAAVLYLSFPTIVVLTVGEIYYSISSFAMISIFCAYIDRVEWPRDAVVFWMGIFAGLSNHKIFMLPLALFLVYLLQCRHRPRPSFKEAISDNAVVLGYLAGIALFWMYGLCVDSGTFLVDHFRHHLLDRVLHKNVLGYTGYYSVFGMWKNFLNWPFLLLCIMAIWQLRKKIRCEAIAQILFLWALIGALAYSIVDWREMGHISLITLPLLITVFYALSDAGRRRSYIFAAFVSVIIIINLVFFYSATGDFTLILNKLGWL